jgi:hypothetical protein
MSVWTEIQRIPGSITNSTEISSTLLEMLVERGQRGVRMQYWIFLLVKFWAYIF